MNYFKLKVLVNFKWVQDFLPVCVNENFKPFVDRWSTNTIAFTISEKVNGIIKVSINSFKNTGDYAYSWQWKRNKQNPKYMSIKNIFLKGYTRSP